MKTKINKNANDKKSLFTKKLIILFISLIITLSISAQNIETKNFKILPGSNIYVRMFLFYFPISNEYNIFINKQDDFFNIDMTILNENIKTEPATPSFFESNLTFHIVEIPYNVSGVIKLPISIQCNQKFIKKRVNLTVYQKENILIIKGAVNNLLINEITDNAYFKNRFFWKYPIYFDVRLQILK